MTGLIPLLIFMVTSTTVASDNSEFSKQQSKEKNETFQMEEVVVKAQRLKENIELTPGSIQINLENYKKAGVPHSILDILKDRAIIDYRGLSDLSNENDDIQMRGFDTRQFTTALDGLSIQKTGGYWGGHFVDYNFIPLEQIDRIEIMPGPHCALYEGKSFGGVLNIITKTPKLYETPEYQYKLLTSYASLNTTDNTFSMSGGGGIMNYVFSYNKYHSDGFLKNSDTDLTNVSTKLSWLLPSDGYISILGIYSDKKTRIPSVNDPETNYYDSDYPIVLKDTVSSRWRDPAMESARNKYAHSLRFDWRQPSEIGTWSLGAYYAYEDQRYIKNEWEANVVPNNTWWVSYGAKIQNDIQVFNDHTLSFGCDFANLNRRYATEIVRTFALFIQDQWQINPQLKFTPGFRYEDLTIWWSNYSTRGGGHYINPNDPREDIPRQYDNLIPKAFVSYALDDLNPHLKDTVVSLGVSRVWTPRANCEVCTWGSGIEQEPTKGHAIDLIFQKRLWGNIELMMDISHYDFDNYVIFADGSSNYYKKSPWTRRMIGLSGVKKNGIEMELNGDFTDDLSMNLSFAYVDWKYTDSKPGSIEDMSANALSDRAKYRINAGLTYNLNEQTQFHLDYYHQDKQMKEVLDIIDEDAGIFEIRNVQIDSYGVMDASVLYTFFEHWKRIEKPTLKVYCNNLFDADYVNMSGYPATERTFGISLTCNF